MDKIALSFSRLNTFEQCQAKFDYLYVSKVVKDEMGEASAYGDRVHKTLQAYGEGKLNLSKLTLEQMQTIQKWGKHVDFMLSRTNGTPYFEKQLCVDHNLTPVDWFSKSAYIRSIVDLLIIDGDTAYCIDYKTGKVKDDETQLKLFAYMIFAHFPQVTTVKTSYLWLLYGKATNVAYTRTHAEDLWQSIKPRFDAVIETVDLGYFETTPSGLCGYCPARKICPDARTRR